MEQQSLALVPCHGDSLFTSENTAPEAAGTQSRPPVDARERKRILLIEADEAIAQLVLALLADEDVYDVVRASDPTDALRAIAPSITADEATDQGADLVMLDLAPLDSEHKRALRALFEARKKWPPMIILSGWPIQYVENVLIGINKPGVIAKPFDVDTLLCTVRKILKTNVE